MNRPVTSCSNFFRRRLCPGSQNIEANCPPLPDTIYSLDGNLFHDVMAGKAELGVLKIELQALALRFFAERDDAIKVVFRDEKPVIEHEVTLLDVNEKEIGHADLIAYKNGLGLILDWKSGYLKVQDIEDNDQVRGYAIYAADQFFLNKIYVGIAHRDSKMKLCCYDSDGLEAANLDINSMLGACDKPDAPLVPGTPQCTNCRGIAGSCPKASEIKYELGKVDVGYMKQSEYSDFLKKIRVAEANIKAMKQKIYLDVENAEAENRKIKDLSMKPGGSNRVIIDVSKAYELVADVIPVSTFTQCVEPKYTALDAAYAKGKNISPGAGKKQLTKLLMDAGVMIMKPKRSKLVIDYEDGAEEVEVE